MRQRRLHGLLKRPVLPPLSAALDPAFQYLALLLGDFLVRFLRRHDLILIMGRDPTPELALIQLAGNDGCIAILVLLQRVRLQVEPQVCFAMLRLRPVALKAGIREDRQDIAAEIDGRLRLRSGNKTNERDENEPGRSENHGSKHAPASTAENGASCAGTCSIVSSKTTRQVDASAFSEKPCTGLAILNSNAPSPRRIHRLQPERHLGSFEDPPPGIRQSQAGRARLCHARHGGRLAAHGLRAIVAGEL